MLSKFKSSSTLMIQGCTSDAGKSVIVAGICRVLARKQHSVAPFKPQNMALNSAVTADGGEIGRAQAVQAQACYLQAHTDMNPILLKPSSDTGAQVILNGKAIGSMQASKYHDYKKVAMDAVIQSHQRLSSQYEQVIVEGAGSPAEINLRDNDIANMGFAEAVDCPVIIIADIDRGGVFAHLVGTLELLSQTEQDRVIGFIINRFRGDIGLLEPGLDWLENRTNKPVLGVIPYLQDFFLDAEDAIANSQLLDNSSQTLKVVVPVLPRISNHTDFDALRMHPNVDLEFVSVSQPCPYADLIILPGSKNVLGDLLTLKENGWQESLNRHIRYGGKIMGICGGYQMLGKIINDLHAIESQLQTLNGFDFLDITTNLEPEKKLVRVTGNIVADGFNNTSISGYEIHCGVSHANSDLKTLVELTPHNDSKTRNKKLFDGYLNQENTVLGTYLHGLFDQPKTCNQLLSWAGIKTNSATNLNVLREQQLDRLADCLESHINDELWQSLDMQSPSTQLDKENIAT